MLGGAVAPGPDGGISAACFLMEATSKVGRGAWADSVAIRQNETSSGNQSFIDSLLSFLGHHGRLFVHDKERKAAQKYAPDSTAPGYHSRSDRPDVTHHQVDAEHHEEDRERRGERPRR